MGMKICEICASDTGLIPFNTDENVATLHVCSTCAEKVYWEYLKWRYAGNE